MTLSLSRRARVALRQFLAFWIRPKHRFRYPHEVAEAIDKLEDARRRNDCRDISYWRRRLRETRLDGLSLEVHGKHWRMQ